MFFNLAWYEIYDLLEFTVKCENQNNNPEDPENETNVFISECNHAFEGEKSAFRFVDTKIVRIVDKAEISEVEKSLKHRAAIPGAKYHIERALSIFSKRENPDYPNSIKESISAVEAMCRIITGDEKASLGMDTQVMQREYGMPLLIFLMQIEQMQNLCWSHVQHL